MNSDPRRPEKVQRFVPKNGNGNEDLTPDYMNILGQTTATTSTTTTTTNSSTDNQDLNQSNHLNQDDDTSHSNVIPASPQYGVAIIPTDGGIIAQPAAITQQPPQIVDDNNKVNSDDNKDMQTTNRNDRFKVVKIASLEPFKRGRWKCMDYMDEAPPAGTIRIPQSTGGNIQLPYMQTQSLPQQQIQQMLQATQFFAPATQILPQGQFFYPQNQQQQIPSTMPAQFIANQTYFPMVQNAGNFIPQNVQYVPIPNQNSAFVPTTQNVQLQQGFQQQGQSFNNQQQQQQQNVVNGFATGQQKEQVLQQQKSVVNSPSQQLVQNYQNYQQPVATVTPMQVQQQQQIVQQQQIPQQQQQQQQQETTQQVENNELAVPETVATATSATTENGESDATTDKTNPVVNAIDNKIEQAMDLVKSHLMYTVREEVEVLKEKIAELMERIQQLESENNFLRAQIPKSQNLPPAPNYITNVAQGAQQQGNGGGGVAGNASVVPQSAGNVAVQQAAQQQQANVVAAADSSVKSQGQGQ